MAEQKIKLFSVEEYLALEDQAVEKSEYDHGQIVGMSGCTINHGIIGNNMNAELRAAVQDKELDCTPINSEVKIFIEQADSFVYPDGMIICGELETHSKDANSITNPLLIVEVLSKSSERYDRGDKFYKYCSLPSFKEYVLIDQEKPVIDVLYRENTTYWRMVTTIGLDKSIYLHTLDVHISMRDIYRNAQGLATPQFQLDV